MRLILASTTMLAASCAIPNPADAQEVIHHLSVAAATSELFTDADAEAVIAKMNNDLQTKYYPWDVTCPGIKFVLDGHVFTSPNLLSSGTYEELVANLKKVDPSANVFVVAGVMCGQITAAGCGPIGGEPEVVGDQWPDYDDQIWLHERGHNMDLPHSAEAPLTDTQVPENVGKRIMFWQLGIGHYGKTSAECSAFGKVLYASETTTGGGPQSSGSVISPAQAAAPTTGAGVQPTNPPAANGSIAPAAPPPAQPPANATSYPNFQQQEQEALAKTGLTPEAFRVVGVPWLEGAPIDQIKALKDADINSIRRLLTLEPSQYTAQAAIVLGLVGTAGDAAAIAKPLSIPAAAVPPGTLDAATRRGLRWAAATKTASVQALGLLAARTGSPDAVKTLVQHIDLKAASSTAGPANAEAFSRNALLSLSKANSPSARETVEQAISAATRATTGTTAIAKSTTTIRTGLGTPANIPVPTDKDVQILQTNLSRQPSGDLESLLR